MSQAYPSTASAGLRAKSCRDLYDQKARMFSRMLRLAQAAARRAHPETNGEDLLCHNWGNAEAKAAWARAWARWYRLTPAYETMYAASEHRAHAGRFSPFWCKHCQGAKS